MHRRLPVALACVAVVTAVAASSCAVRVRPGGAVVVRPAPARVYVAPAPAPPPARVYVAPAPPPAQPVYHAQPAPPQQPPPPAGYPPPAPPPAAAPPPACVDPADRDISDRFEHGMPIGPGTTIGCTHRGDADVFVVAAPPGNAGHVIVYTLRGSHEMAPVMQVLDANRASLHRHHGPRSSELKGWIHVAGGTSVYLRVSQVHGASEPYTLTLAASALTEPGEPNGEIERATPLAENGFVQAYLSNPANDPAALNDWYRVDVTRDGNLTLDCDMSQDIAPVLEVKTAMRRPVVRKSGARSERIQVPVRVQRGTYYVRVGTFHGVASAGAGDPPTWLTRPYKLTLSR
jgi:hypothetical protein